MRLDNYIYLDHNATSLLSPQVWQAMEEVTHLPLNASSIHRLGQQAKKILAASRQNLCDFVDCTPEELIFTSGGTESNNMVLLAPWDHIFVLATDHDSIFKVRPEAQVIPVTSQGLIQLEWLKMP